MKLLDVAELDARLDVLRHQLASIPEAAALAELAGDRRAVDDSARDLRVAVADLTEEQSRADADVEQVKARRERDQAMVDAGSISDPKALQRMLGELESLARRISDLEDVEIEVMERLEEAQSGLTAREAEVERLDAKATTLEQTRARKAAEIETELGAISAERTTAVSGLPADLVSLYEKLRASKGGIGAAPLRARECGGCRLTLNPSDLAAITKAPVDEVVRCEECGRILVRTAESGL